MRHPGTGPQNISGRGLPAAVLLSLCCGSCNLVLGLEREDLPEKTETPCTTNLECDDIHACTQDICQLPRGTCTHYMLTREDVCRPKSSDNVCDIAPEYCDGTSSDCPDDALEPPTTECRAAEGQCDEPENCDGLLPACPDNAFSLPDKTCDDGDDCTFDDMCDGAGGCSGTNGLQDAEQVSIGPWGLSTCALLSTDDVRCWGNNGNGQVGDGTDVNKFAPVPVQGLPAGTELASLSAGGRHVCVLLETGSIMCWGRGDCGQLGNGGAGYDYEEHEAVPAAETPGGWKKISGGYMHTCAIQQDDSAWCWGKNEQGQLGDGTLVDQPSPVAVTGLGQVADIVAGSYHSCAIDTTGSLWCWGQNDSGQLGTGTTEDSTIPAGVEGIASRVLAVAIGTLHTCALLDGGGVMCWGENEFGQLGIGTDVDSAVPVAVSGLPSAAGSISSGYEHTCALLEGGGGMCWGNNDKGQLGDGTEGNVRSQPVSVVGLPGDVVSIATGSFHTCVLRGNTTLLCWGQNAYGQLGDGTIDNSLQPVVVVCG